MLKAFTLSLLTFLCLLVQAQKPQLYALTSQGGSNNAGALVKFDANTNTLTALYSFGVSTGSNPAGSLLKASNGKLYGLTQFGGTANKGVLFSFDLSSNTYQKLYDFTGTNGAEPTGSLIQASNGKLYGLASKGGTADKGVIFSFDLASNSYQKLQDFTGPNGAEPHGSLLQAKNGKLYGLTAGGGGNNFGTIFSYDIASTSFTSLHSFVGADPTDLSKSDGAGPHGSLVEATDGRLYGLTIYGGTNGGGTVFYYEPSSSTFKKLASPDPRWGYGYGTPIIAPDNKLYWLARGIDGLKTAGGIVLYDLSIPDNFGTYYSVALPKDEAKAYVNGTYPQGSLLLASDGLMYGMTTEGGLPNHKGVVFSFKVSGGSEDYTKLKDFSGPDGARPIYGQFIEVATAPPANATLISKNATWKYNDKGIDLGSAWRATEYDDASWSSGTGVFGYGDPVTATLGYGPNSSNKYRSYYFRKSFDVANPSIYTGLTFNIRRDDGAVVYLNGVEVFRTNMPGGTVSYQTFASSSIGGSDETNYFTYNVPTTQLKSGKNVIAVSVHQGDATSSDMLFDMEVKGEGSSSGNQPPTVSLTAPANATQFTAPATIQFTATASDPDGSIAKVEFYEGSNKIGEDLTAPYEFTWTGVPERGYNLTASATDNMGTITASSTVSITVRAATTCPGTGSITRETWPNVTGTSVSAIPVNTIPSFIGPINSFETSTDVADQYGQRIRGYVCPPAAGSYTFYIAGDDDCELYLSTSDNPAKKQRIAFITNGWTNPKEWTKYPSQKSEAITLQAGTKYYIEGLHKEGWAGDNFAVGWMTPGSSTINVIPGSVLAPMPENQAPTISLTSPSNASSFTAPASINLIATASDSDIDGSVIRVEFYEGFSNKLAEDLTAPYTFTWTGVGVGTHSLRAVAVDNSGGVTWSSTVTVTVNAAPPANGTLISKNSVWKYNDKGVDLGTAWKAIDYDDATWSSGTGVFGYGDPVTTTLSYEPNSSTKYPSYYFRKSFDVADASQYNKLVFGIRRDDGAVVYLNGVELFRTNMPDGAVGYNTLASVAQGGSDETTYFGITLPATQLRNGTNVIAVSVHQSDRTSSDLSFDLELIGEKVANQPPTVNITSPANGSAFNDPAIINLTAIASDADGTVSKVEFYSKGIKIGEDVTAPYAFTWVAGPGDYLVVAKAVDNSGNVGTSSVVSVTVSVPRPESDALIAKSSPWKYNDKGVDLGMAWKEIDYYDGNWSEARGSFGYDDPVVTTISYGSNASLKHPSYYFRKSFDITNVSSYTGLVFNIRRDDGAVVYLNGVEVFRTNMPGGTVGYSTLASSSLGGSDETNYFTYQVPTTQLRTGKNVVAVSVHQGSRSSSDMSFDLELKGETTSQLAAARISSTTSTNKEEVVTDDKSNTKLTVTALPNPSTTHFTLVLQSGSLETVALKVVDATGRTVEMKRKLSSNGTLTIGADYRPGMYFLEVLQGKERRTLKLVKGTE